ncbi:MAG: CoA pyrophosphatase [Myxococcales bacterium]
MSESSQPERVPEPLDEALRARILGHLAARRRTCVELSAAHQRAAAVCVTLVPGPRDEASFLLTRRPGDLSRHPGQFALPGGRLEPAETPEQAARRELGEELGVTLEADSVLGSLDDFTTHSGFVITPVVLWGPLVRTLAPDPREVAIAYRIPLRELYGANVPRFETVAGLDGPLISLPLVGTHIYSPTAAIVYQFREVALEGRDVAVQHFAQPRFAWR